MKYGVSFEICEWNVYTSPHLLTFQNGPTSHLRRDAPSSTVPKWPFTGPQIYHEGSNFCH